MPWQHAVNDPNEGNFVVCVNTPNDDPPTKPVRYTSPKTKQPKTIPAGAGWTHVDKCPSGSVPGTENKA